MSTVCAGRKRVACATGVIGAGLFVGSANAIEKAGPAVIISYALARTLVVLAMRMLGEMATANPNPGSFSVYSHRALGRWAGFRTGTPRSSRPCW